MVRVFCIDICYLKVTYLVHSRHFGPFIQQQLHYLYVPHFCGFDKWGLSLLQYKHSQHIIISILTFIGPLYLQLIIMAQVKKGEHCLYTIKSCKTNYKTNPNGWFHTLVQLSVSGLHCRMSLTMVALPFSTAQ